MRLTRHGVGVLNGLCGAGLLVSLAAVRSLASATGTAVYWMGGELHWECFIRARFGVPCPTCGMTRSVLLTLHGQWRAAAEVNPGGPLLVLGLLALACVLLAASFRAFTRGRPWSDTATRKAALAASAYGGVVTVVLLGHWLRALM